MKGLIFLVLLGVALAQLDASLVEMSSQIIQLQEQGLSPNEIPLDHEEGESEFELFSRFMELEAEAKPGAKKDVKAAPKATDPVLAKARKLARKLVFDLKKGLRNNFAKDFDSAAAGHTKAFSTTLYAKCRGYAPTPAMCNNVLVTYRETFYKQNPFSKKNQPRFGGAIASIIMKYVKAWRKANSQPKGNPFAAVPDGVDPFKGIRIKTDVNGHLNRFGRVNAKKEVDEAKLKKVGILPDAKDNADGNGVWKADRAIKQLAKQLRTDLRSLRSEVLRVFGRGKFGAAITSKKNRRQAAERVVKICRNLKQQIDFAPTFCKSVGFLLQVNFVGKNPFNPKSIDNFAAVLAAFMQHNHRIAVRGGDIKVARRGKYEQDTMAITVNLKLRVTPNRFNLRSLAKEFVNVLASILRIPEQRIRVTAVSLPRVRITFEFVADRKDKETNSDPNSPESVDALATMFRGMAKDKTSDFYKTPVLSRLLPRSLTISKLLGVGPAKAKAIKQLKQKAKNAKKPVSLKSNKKVSQAKGAKAGARFAEEGEQTQEEESVEVLQQELQAIAAAEQAEDTLTEEEEEQQSAEVDEEMEEDLENPDAVPAEEEEISASSFLEAVSAADSEADDAEEALTEENIRIPAESLAAYESDPWLVLISTRSEEYITAEAEGDAEDTDEEEEANEEEEELAMEEEAEDEIPDGVFIEDEAEISEEEEEASAETEEAEIASETAAPAADAEEVEAEIVEPTAFVETSVSIEKAAAEQMMDMGAMASSAMSVSSSIFLIASLLLAVIFAL